MSGRTKHQEQLLNEAFNLFRFNGSVFFRSSLASPWGIQLSADPAIRFHIALKGRFTLGCQVDHLLRIEPGEIGIVAANQRHWIADHPNSDKTDQGKVLQACNLNSPLFQRGEISHHIICCRISLESGLTHPLLEKLPALLAVRDLHSDDEIWSIIDLIDQNLEAESTFQNPVTDRLVEILFIHIMKRIIDSTQGDEIMDALIADRRIFQALNIIHKSPQHNWTVIALGEQVGMSKSTLNRQFLLSVGETPMAYLTELRLNKAYSLIKNASLSFDDIAALTGYASSRSLNKAFAKRFGVNMNRHRQGKEGE